MVEVSIIIPTYKDWTRLSICLEALSSQSFSSDLFEIIVVNNCPDDDIPHDFFSPGNCTMLRETKPGSYASRNAALKIAKGAVIGFTDSDCIPDVNWIRNAVAFLQKHTDCSRVGGNIKLFYRSEKLTDAELYESVYAFRQLFAASKGISVTGNMFTYQKVFDAVGDFNETLLSGGDNEWSLRAQEKGFKILYAEEVVVQHPARFDMRELATKSKRVAGNIGNDKKKAFVRLLKYSIPPLRVFKDAQGKGLSFKSKFIVFKIRYYLNLIRSIEEINVSLGKVPERN